MEPTSVRPASSYRWADFVALAEDDRRELIDGELLEIDMPTKLHEWVVGQLIFWLVGWARAHDGLVLASGYKVRIRDDRGVMPDVQFFRKERVPMLGEQGLESGAPDLAVEVISASSKRYDRVEKLRWYAMIATPEYWIVDPEGQTIERLVLQESHYRIEESLAGDEVFRPGSFPGLEIPLIELWRLPGHAG